MNSVKLVFVNVFCLFEKFDENSIREFEKIGNLKSSLSENIKILCYHLLELRVADLLKFEQTKKQGGEII